MSSNKTTQIVAAATIRERLLFITFLFSSAATIQDGLLFECGYYSRAYRIWMYLSEI